MVAEPKNERPRRIEIASNHDYLSLRLDYVRGRVALAARLAVTAPQEAEKEAPKLASRLGALLVAIRQEAAQARKRGVRLPFEELVERFELDQTSATVLMLALSPYLDPEIPTLFRQLAESYLVDRCTVGIALRILGRDAQKRLALRGQFEEDGPLVRQGLLEVAMPPGQSDAPLLERVLNVPTRIVDFVLGRLSIDEKVRPYCSLVRARVRLEDVVMSTALRREVLELVTHHDRYRRSLDDYGFRRVIPYGSGVVLLFAGPPGTGKTMLGLALGNALSRPVLRVHSDRLAEAEEGIEPVVQALFREADLHGAIVLFDDCESLFRERGSRLSALLSELDQYEGIVVLTTNLPHTMDLALERRIVYRIDFDIPSPAEREQIWELHLPPDAPLASDIDIPILANQYRFSGGTIKNAVLVALNKALSRDPDEPRIDMELLREAANTQIQFHLEEFSHKSTVHLTLDDLVLPEDESRQVRELLAAGKNREFVMNRWGFGDKLVTGTGLIALFDGPPGTGKTLCAEILANELDKSLYRVSIPRIVSKYVGETEKHIEEVFARARASHAMLLFDEADALFGKRTADTKSSTDRYANMEVNLLLQEIERFEGIVILTTNLFGSLDDALIRRIQFRISFPFPEPDDRARIWETLMPAEAPLGGDVDLKLLARHFELAGGNIKNALLRAAYRAVELGTPIDMERLEQACLQECKAMGKVYRAVSPRAKRDPVPRQFGVQPKPTQPNPTQPKPTQPNPSRPNPNQSNPVRTDRRRPAAGPSGDKR